jgi:prevent-host-death family protein
VLPLHPLHEAGACRADEHDGDDVPRQETAHAHVPGLLQATTRLERRSLKSLTSLWPGASELLGVIGRTTKNANRAAPAREVGALEAKSKLGQLLDLVEQGEEIIITRRGKPVASLSPPRRKIGRDEARAAIERVRARAEQRQLGRFDWDEWKALRDEGRP